MRKYLTKHLIAVIDVKSFRIVGKVSGGVIAGFNGMTFPSDGLLSDYQANAGITLTGECLITLTKSHILNDNFTAACVTYENTTNFLFKINGSNPMAQFMVINNRIELRAHDRSRITIYQKKLSFARQNLDQLIKRPFQTILGPLIYRFSQG